MTETPGKSTTTNVTVTNSGSRPVVLGAARLVDAAMSTSAPLTVVGSTCDGVTLEAGSVCSVTVSYAAGAAASREGKGVLALRTDVGEWELGTVGQQPPAYSGPQALAGPSSPGRVDLSWKAPLTLDSRLIAGWRVEDLRGGTPVVLQTRTESYLTATTLTSPDTGTHLLRLVLSTTDGREVASEPYAHGRLAVVAGTTPSRGVQAYDADGGVTNGGTLGDRASLDRAASPPRRPANASWSAKGRSAAGRAAPGPGRKPAPWTDIRPDLRRRRPGRQPGRADGRADPPRTLRPQNRPSSLITVPAARRGPDGRAQLCGPVQPRLDSGRRRPHRHRGLRGRPRADRPDTGARTSISGTTGAAAVRPSPAPGELAYALTGWGGSGQGPRSPPHA